jgi:hypothetical protein
MNHAAAGLKTLNESAFQGRGISAFYRTLHEKTPRAVTIPDLRFSSPRFQQIYPQCHAALPRCQYPQKSTDGPRFSAADAPGDDVLEIGSR